MATGVFIGNLTEEFQSFTQHRLTASRPSRPHPTHFGNSFSPIALMGERDKNKVEIGEQNVATFSRALGFIGFVLFAGC